MDKFLRFVAGVVISIAYGAIALFIASAITSLTTDLWALCLIAVIVGWVAIIVLALRKEQPWIAYGVLAAPFIVLLFFTVSCFVGFSVNSAASPA